MTPNYNSMIFDAVRQNNTQLVEQHLPFVTRNSPYSVGCLTLAVSNNNIDMVRMLITVFNPKINQSAALRTACRALNEEMVDLLYPLSNPQNALEEMRSKSHQYPPKGITMLEHRIQAHHEKLLIEQEISHTHGTRPNKKI